MEIIASSVVDAVKRAISALQSDGVDVPRHVGPWTLKTDTVMNLREIHGLQIIIPHTSSANRWHNYVSRGQVLEFFDLIGFENPGFLHHLWPFYRQWLDRSGTYPYTYGQRLAGYSYEVNQWKQAVRMLRQDPTTRHVYLVIRRPGDLIEEYQPCSLGVFFQLNSEKELDMHWYMRSNDVAVGGLARNLFINLHIMEQMCYATGLPMGDYYHYDANVHFYEDDVTKIGDLSRTIISCPFPSSTDQTILLTDTHKSKIRGLMFRFFETHLPVTEMDVDRALPRKEGGYYHSLLKFVLSLPMDQEDIIELRWLKSLEAKKQ